MTIFATGHLVWKAIEAARELEKEGVSVDLINIHTIKPLDEEAVLASAKKTGCVVTCEEHNMYGGLGSAVAECLSKHQPPPRNMSPPKIPSGSRARRMSYWPNTGWIRPDVVKAVKSVMKRKG